VLITQPKILVLDEPTYGVDPESRKEFWKILYRLNQDGMTILVSTPYMDEAELCQRVAFINRGKIAVVDSPAGLRKSFGHQVLELRTTMREPVFLDNLPGVLDYCSFGYKYHIVTDDIRLVREGLDDYFGHHPDEKGDIEEVCPSMEDVFVSLAEKEVW
jgi:ABC-2 type transport system ATP-binding protein